MWDGLAVAHLFKLNTKQWNENFLNYVIDIGTTNQFLNTPLLASVHVDTATWKFEKKDINQFVVCIEISSIMLTM
jgi:hypothetical protein